MTLYLLFLSDSESHTEEAELSWLFKEYEQAQRLDSNVRIALPIIWVVFTLLNGHCLFQHLVLSSANECKNELYACVLQYCKEALRKFFLRFTEVYESWLPEETIQYGKLSFAFFCILWKVMNFVYFPMKHAAEHVQGSSCKLMVPFHSSRGYCN